MAVIQLSDTWLIKDYANVFAKAVKGKIIKSPFLSSLKHFQVPGVKWRLAFCARGDKAAQPNCASVFVEAVFDRKIKKAVSSVWVEWDLIIVGTQNGRMVVGMELTEYSPKMLSVNSGPCFSWGYKNAFEQVQLERAVKDGSLEMQLVLRIFNVVDLLKCRESVRTLFADPRHKDFTLKVGDKDFPVHRAILGSISGEFTDAFRKHSLSKLEKISEATPDAFERFLRAFYFVDFRFLTDWKLTMDVLKLADKFGILHIERFCDRALAAEIPTMSLTDVFQVLPVAFRCDTLSAKAACVGALKREERWIDSPEWSKFKARNDDIAFGVLEHFVRVINADELQEEKSGVHMVDLQLEYTWAIPTNLLTPSPPSLTSPFCLEHKAFPRVKWEAELFPQGNVQNPDYKPGYASLYLKAVFEEDNPKASSLYAKWEATITTSNGPVYAAGTPEFIVYSGVKEMTFGYANAFQIEHLNAAIDPDKGSLPIQFDLTVASIPEILKSRDLISRLDSDKDFADVEIDVGGTLFKSHKCVLAVRSPIFAAMFETEMRESKTSKVEVKETTPVAFKHFLAVVYYASWDFLADMNATLDVLALAERYGVADLKRYCDETLAHFVNATNLFDILTHAAIHNAEATKAACVEILFANEQMTRSNGWINFKRAVNKEIMADVAEALGERYRLERKRKREED